MIAVAGPTDPPRLRRSWVQRFIILMNLFLISAALGTAALLNYGYGRAASINRVALDRSLTALPSDVGRGERVLNVLLVGSDSSANLDEDDPIQVGRQGERFGDVIIIAHLDERTGEIALLSLPRDLWVTVSGSGRESRINRAFEIGGPANLIDTIEDEFDIPIHHYVNVDFAGFQGLVAAVGSIDVYFDTPARDWNVNASPPRSQTGFLVTEPGCRSLDPETALAYVRSRYYQTQDGDGEWMTDPTADLGRIRRQQDFLRRVIQQAIDMGARNPFVLRDLIDTGLENVAIDDRLTPQLLLDVGTTYRSFDPERLQTYSFPSRDERVGNNQVLVPLRDEAAPLVELFAGAPFDDPSTVRVAVLVEPEAENDGRKNQAGVGARSGTGRLEADDHADILADAGFDVERSTRVDLPVGVVVRHGPDGRHAAEVVAAALDSTVSFEQVAGLIGRSVVVSVGPTEPSGGERAGETGATPSGGAEVVGGRAGNTIEAGPDDRAEGAVDRADRDRADDDGGADFDAGDPAEGAEDAPILDDDVPPVDGAADGVPRSREGEEGGQIAPHC